MRKTFFLAHIFFLGTFSTPRLQAQITAGSVPPEAIVVNPNVNLTANTRSSSVSKPFDMNCDGINDMVLAVRNGAIEVDEPHTVLLRVLDTTFHICSELDQYSKTPNYYKQNDVLSCPNGFQWNSDTLYLLGDYAGWFGGITHAPDSVTNRYIAYSKKTQNGSHVFGWLKISLYLRGTIVTSSISEILSYCNSNLVPSIPEMGSIYLSPNPSPNGMLYVKNPNQISRIEIMNSAGQNIKIIEGSTSEIFLPEAKGIYFLKTSTQQGEISVQKIIRN